MAVAAEESEDQTKRPRRRARRAQPTREESDITAEPVSAKSGRKRKKRAVTETQDIEGFLQDGAEEEQAVLENACEDGPGMLLADLVNDEANAVKSLLRPRIKRRAPPVRSDHAELESSSDEEAAFRVVESRLAPDMVKAANIQEPVPPAKQVAPPDEHEGQPESEFLAGGVDEEVTAEDLMMPFAAAGSKQLRKQLQSVANREPMKDSRLEVKRSREERTAQYESTSQNMQRWVPQMDQMLKDDQVVLGEADSKEIVQGTSAIVETFDATDDFEKEMEEITASAGADEQSLRESRQLPVNKRLKEEKEFSQVAKLKALMAREQRASKRVNKIKSKAYRRIHRKGEEKSREALLQRLEVENPELATSLKKDYEKKHAQLRLQRQNRARQKWAKTIQRFGRRDGGIAQEVTKQAQDAKDEQQSLRRAIQGRDTDESDEEADLSGDDEKDPDRPHGGTIDRAKELTMETLKDLEEGRDLPMTGILGLSFMRKAIEQKREDSKNEAKKVLQELDALDNELHDNEKETAGVPEKTVGSSRKQFTEQELAEARKQVDAMFEGDGGEAYSVSGPLNVRSVAEAAGSATDQAPPSPVEDESHAPNPWLDGGLADSGDGPALKGKAPKKGAASKVAAKRGKKKGPKAVSKTRDKDEDHTVPVVEPAPAEPLVADEAPADWLTAFSTDADEVRTQREMVRTAFVEGLQEKDFIEEQEEIARKNSEKDDVDDFLPGWGSWTGQDIKPKRRKPVNKEPPKKKYAGNVVKYEGPENGKYFAGDLPYGYRSPDMYNHEMRMPTGPEWNTMTAHTNKIKPKFFMKVGAIVPPLQYVKHLPRHTADSALKAWAAGKQPKRLKARL